MKPCRNPNCSNVGQPHPNCRCWGGMATGGEVGSYCEKGEPHSEDCEYFAKGGDVKAKSPKIEAPIERDTAQDFSRGFTQATGTSSFRKLAEGGEAEVPTEPPGGNAEAEPIPAPAPVVAPPAAPPVNININAQPQQQAQAPVPAPTPEAPAAPPAAQVAPEAPPAEAPAPEAQAPAQGLAPETAETKAMEPTPQAPGTEISEGGMYQEPMAKRTPAQTFQEHKQETVNNLTMAKDEYAQALQAGAIQPKTYKQLFAEESTLGKIGTLFGLMLSGAGSGLTGQPNAVLKMMEQEIEKDYEAQKASHANAQNFLRFTQDRMRNQADIGKIEADTKNTEARTEAIPSEIENREASTEQLKMQTEEAPKLNAAQIRAQNAASAAQERALTISQMDMTAIHNLVENVNKMPPGPQKVQAEQQLAMMQAAVNEKNAMLIDRAAVAAAWQKTLFGDNATQGGSSEDAFKKQTSSLRMIGADKRAEELESKHFPGLKGQASIPLTPGDREAINSGITFQQKLDNFTDWTKKHSGSLSPTEIGAGEAMAAELQGAYRQATNGGVYKEGEQNFISKLIDSTPTKFFNSIRVLPQLAAIGNENKSRLNQLVKSKGFEGYQPESSSKKGSDTAKAEGDSEIKTMGGVQYKKVPGGWQKV